MYSEIPVKLGEIHEGLYLFWTCDSAESSEMYEQVIFDEILTSESLKSVAKVSDDYCLSFGYIPSSRFKTLGMLISGHMSYPLAECWLLESLSCTCEIGEDQTYSIVRSINMQYNTVLYLH